MRNLLLKIVNWLISNRELILVVALQFIKGKKVKSSSLEYFKSLLDLHTGDSPVLSFKDFDLSREDLEKLCKLNVMTTNAKHFLTALADDTDEEDTVLTSGNTALRRSHIISILENAAHDAKI